MDWAARIPDLRRADELAANVFADIATRLTAGLPGGATVVDVGAGTGGMSAALAATLGRRGGGCLLLVDAVPELLAEAARTATAVGADGVKIETVEANLAAGNLSELVPPAQLIWAASVMHHLPDQQGGIASVAGALSGGGVLAVAEGGLETQTLPWDLGVGRPGLEHRLLAARDEWFGEMRAGIEGTIAMPYGWTTALRRAGLTDVGSFSHLLDHPAPTTDIVREFVLQRIAHLAEDARERLTEEDRGTVERLLQPGAGEYLGDRDDLYVLGTKTVHFGRKS
ncbi:class I SAM-dependent methyltransferase [Amycolatopsis acidicola]|uniref:class I SAM-dependent methyltransferase n=1 Tax=Amycolatopsis acidicola TaxID=2596893 RepID=UPI001FB6B4F9|nr:class I SAM-dependent methyltransferase [Amycolatopsis acidicola]